MSRQAASVCRSRHFQTASHNCLRLFRSSHCSSQTLSLASLHVASFPLRPLKAFCRHCILSPFPLSTACAPFLSVLAAMSDSGSSQRPGTAGASSDGAGGQDITAVVQEMLTAMVSSALTCRSPYLTLHHLTSPHRSLLEAPLLSVLPPLARSLTHSRLCVAVCGGVSLSGAAIQVSDDVESNHRTESAAASTTPTALLHPILHSKPTAPVLLSPLPVLAPYPALLHTILHLSFIYR